VWQDLMEKTITLAVVTGQKRFSASLSKLVENYAELLASQGLLSTAMEYLKLLGSDGSSQELTILRERITFSAEQGKKHSSWKLFVCLQVVAFWVFLKMRSILYLHVYLASNPLKRCKRLSQNFVYCYSDRWLDKIHFS
jgi:hypothetical protein